MTTIVGIFDNERDLDKSVGRLAHAGFKYTVYDEAIVGGEPGSFGSLVFCVELWSGGVLGQHRTSYAIQAGQASCRPGL